LPPSLHVIVSHTHLIDEKGELDPRLLRGAYLLAFGLSVVAYVLLSLAVPL
jgi:hypothetical protein